MLTLTSKGLYCRAGDFYIDPSRAVEKAVITHSHSDHARRGSKQYYCVTSGEALLRNRVGLNIKVETHDYGKKFKIGDVTVSFHPAGHILGSSQIRIEHYGEVWVASGDYKRDPDPTCEAFEVVKCDTFVTEATFGTPSYVWDKKADLAKEIFEWWDENAKNKINSVLFAYSLGKAQRVLGLLEPYAKKPIICHHAATPLNKCYASQGVKLAPTLCFSEIDKTKTYEGELFLLPQAFLNSKDAHILGDNYQTAFASGWMADNHSYDKGFLLSDHADWNDLVRTCTETGAKTVYVQHRGHGALVKHLKKLGINAYPESELAKPQAGPEKQLELF